MRKRNPVAAAPGAAAAGTPTRLGILVAGSAPGALIVEFEGSGPLPARSIAALDEAAIARAVATRQPALLVFEEGDACLPILLGLVQPTPSASLFASLLAPAETSAPTAPREARIDDRRIVLEGKDEVTLRCGEASITLRSDGKVILRGAYVESTAKGVNRIRGGSVKIN